MRVASFLLRTEEDDGTSGGAPPPCYRRRPGCPRAAPRRRRRRSVQEGHRHPYPRPIRWGEEAGEEVHHQGRRARTVLADGGGEGGGEPHEDAAALHHHLRHVDAVHHPGGGIRQWVDQGPYPIAETTPRCSAHISLLQNLPNRSAIRLRRCRPNDFPQHEN